MGELSIKLPPELEHWIDVRLSQGRYVDLEDYVRDLLRRDLDGLILETRDDVEWVRKEVATGLASEVRNKDAFETLSEIQSGRKARRA